METEETGTGSMKTTTKGLIGLLTLVILPTTCAIVATIITNEYSAASELKYVRWEQYPNCTDLIVQSNSSRPFIIYSYSVLIQQVLRDPPARELNRAINDAPKLGPLPAPIRRRRVFQWDRVTGKASSPVCAHPLPIDSIMLRIPEQPQLNVWMLADGEAKQAKAYEPERFALRYEILNVQGAVDITVGVAYGTQSIHLPHCAESPLNVVDDNSKLKRGCSGPLPQPILAASPFPRFKLRGYAPVY